MSVIRTTQFFTRELVAADSKRSYVFGDNLLGRGTAGQACIRGLPNAFGIPTKKGPGRKPGDYFTDDEYDRNVQEINAALAKIPNDKPIVVNINIGLGLAQLDEKAPKTYRYLRRVLMLDLGLARKLDSAECE